MNRVAPVAAAALLALALTGCGGGGTPSATDDPVVTPVPTETGSNPVPSGDAAPCTREEVTQEYVATDNTAGQAHGILKTTNTSPEACTLDGYAVVYMGSGEVAGPIGQPAQFVGDASALTPIVLEPGNVAIADLTITQAGNLDGCNLATTTHLVASPPVDHDYDWEVDGQHVDIDETNICYNDDIGLLSVGTYELVAD